MFGFEYAPVHGVFNVGNNVEKFIDGDVKERHVVHEHEYCVVAIVDVVLDFWKKSNVNWFRFDMFEEMQSWGMTYPALWIQ